MTELAGLAAVALLAHGPMAVIECSAKFINIPIDRPIL